MPSPITVPSSSEDQGESGRAEEPRSGRCRRGRTLVPLLVLAALAAASTPRWSPAWAQSTYEGFGASTPGGAGGSVVHVTNLNDTGAGSLRTALLAGNRTIVFDVAGTINLGSPLYVKGAFITIDGFTAPSPGITLRGDALVIRGNQGAHDVIVRGLRVRDAPLDGIQIAYGAYNVVVDHVSVAGSGDGNLDITEDVHDVTVSWSILAAPASEKNMLIKYGAHRLSVHHNLFGYAEQRNPTVSTDDAGTPAAGTTIDLRNNLIWEWDFGTGIMIYKGALANVVANYTAAPSSMPVDQAQGVIVCDFDCDGDLTAHALAYAIDNLSGDLLHLDMNAEGNVLDPFPAPAVTTHTAHTAAQAVLAQAGVRPLDAVDQQILAGILLPPPPSGPNLSVSYLSVATAGSALVITDRTTNGSTHEATPSTTRFVLSADAQLSADDIAIGTRAVGTLGAHASSVGSLTVPFPPGIVAGTYFVIARADDNDVVTEANETDNVTMRAVALLFPDLVVSSLTAPSAAAPGSSIAVSDTTRNQGTVGASVGSTTRVFLSTDTILDAGDVPLGSRAVAALGGGASSNKTTTVTIPLGTPGGTYFLLGIADGDDVVTELNEGNNLALRALTVTGPDLIVQSLTLPKTSVKPGAKATVTEIAANVGSAAPSSVTRYHLSTSLTGGANDPVIGTRNVAALAAGAQHSGSASITIPGATAPGTYYVIGRADGPNTVDEADETNNALARPLEVGMDLTVTSLSTPAWISAGAPVDVSEVTKNQGTGTAPQSTTAFFLSPTAALTAESVWIGSRGVPALANGAISSAITPVPVPSGVAGDFYIIALANAGAGMGGDTNNVRSRAIRVGPDLVVSGLNAPNSAKAGTTITVTDTTRNAASVAALASTTTRLYISPRSVLDGQATYIGERGVPALSAGHNNAQAKAVTLPGGLVPGPYYIIAESDADGAILEYLETNNTRSRAITIAP